MKKNQTSIFASTNNILTAAVNKAIAKVQPVSTSVKAPTKTSTTAVKPYTSVVSPATSTMNRVGQTAQKVYSVDQTTKQAVLLNEKQVHEAELVRQLPKDFPIQNWEGMPVKAQVFAIQHSGLSKEDQWTLLNATAPFNVLANAKPIATSGASNTASYEKQPVLKSSASVRPNITSGAGNTGSNGSRSTILQALDRLDAAIGMNNAGSFKEQPAFSGQDIETLRAEQRATHKVTNAYNRLDQTLTDKGIQTSSLSGAGQDIYRSTRNSIADAVVQGTLDSGTQKKMIDDASAGIATSKTAPTSIRDWNARVSQADTASKEMFDMLESVNVDTDHLTTEQSYIIDKAEQQLRDGIINGALDENGVDELIRSICNKVTSETTPPKGVMYVTLGDPKLDLRSEESKRNQIMINRGSAITQANQLLGDALVSIHVDISDLSEKQREIILEERPKLVEGILNGSLNGDAISAFVDNVCYRMATETTPPPGVTYSRILDPSYQPRIQSAEEINKMNSKLNDDEIDVTKFTNGQKISYANAQQKIRNGATKGLLTVEYVDHIYSTLINELSSKELEYEYTDARGRKAKGITTTKDLIDPEDDSIGTRMVRYALDLYGLEYGKPAVLNPNKSLNEQISKTIDCSGLVKYAAYQINPDLGLKGVGNNAYYQMIRMEDGVVWQKSRDETQPDIEELKTGDLLYWADEDGVIVHTAMYAGNGLMVESAGTVHLEEVRYTTYDRDGSKSTLVQVNRLEDSKVAKYATNGNGEE